jgi:hypothetical protein
MYTAYTKPYPNVSQLHHYNKKQMKNTQKQHITQVLLGSTSTTVLLTSDQCSHFTLQILALYLAQDCQGADISTYHTPF